MNEFETNLDIIVRSVVDEASAKKAPREITKLVLGELKDGYVEIPTALSDKLDSKKFSKKLVKAQQEFVDQWQQMIDKGFSSSEEDLSEFMKTYTKFKSLLAKEAPDSKQNAVLKSLNLANVKKLYKGSLKEVEKLTLELVKSTEKKLDSKSYVKKVRQKRRTRVGTNDKELIDDAVEKYEARKKSEKSAKEVGLDKILKTLGDERTTDLRYGKSRRIDAGKMVDPKDGESGDSLTLSMRGGAHGSNLARDMVRSEKSFYKTFGTQTKYKRFLTQEAFQQYLNETHEQGMKVNRQIKEKKPNGQIETRYEPDTYYGVGKRPLTEREKAAGISDAIIKKITNAMGALQKARPDIALEDLAKYFETVQRYNEKAGRSVLSTMLGGTNLSFGKYFGLENYFDIGFGSNDYRKSQEETDKDYPIKNDPVVIEAVKNIFEAMKSQTSTEQMILAEELRQRRAEVNLTISKTNKRGIAPEDDPHNKRRYGRGVSIASLAMKDLISPEDLSESVSEIFSSLRYTLEDAKNGLKTNMRAISSSVKNVEETSEQALTQEKVGDVAELTATKKQTDVVTEDKNSGLNTDEKTDELIAVTKEKSKKLAPSMMEQYGIASSVEDAMCPCKQELSSIANVAQACYNALFNIFNVLQSGKISVASTTRNKKTREEPKKQKSQQDEIKSTSMLIPQIMKPWLNKNAINWRQGLLGKELTDTMVNTKVSNYPYTNVNAIKDITDSSKIIKQHTLQLQQEHAGMYRPYNTDAGIKDVLETQKQLTESTKSIFSSLSKSIFGAIKSQTAEKLLAMNEKELEKIRGERIDRFGLTRSNRLGETGIKARTQYLRSLFGWGKGSMGNPFDNVTISKGVEVDTTKITEALQKAIQNNMFTAQTGGIWQNIIGSMTGYLGQPSLEKSRAEAEGLNQVMANIRDAAQSILEQIKSKELDLRGLQARGQGGSPEARKLSSDLEEQKLALAGILADAATVNEIVKKTGGNVNKITKQLSFASPELRKNNVIIQNINSGLDKNGKALKFQTRTAEVLNYAFRKMARSVGQMIERWILMLNPINLIKRAFQDFTSYDVKWQRTMNVIKYNFRRIIKPAMQWIAQQLVNLIGLGNALVKGIGKAFGKDWDLFDQSAASAEQMREELEQAANVTAGFDELHDIGGESSSNPAMDLMGDIYTPQWTDLYDTIENFGKKVGDVLENIHRLVEGWSFWDWLLLIGGVFAGITILKWLVGLFKGKNPLQSVADGLNFLEKAIGWAILIWAFTEFTKALKDFIDVVGHMKSEEVAQALLALAGAFLELLGVMMILIGVASLLKTSFTTFLGIAIIVGVFAILVRVLTDFIEVVSQLTSNQIFNGLFFLATALGAITAAVAILVAVFTALVSTGLGVIAIILLGVILAVVGLVIEALADLVEALKGAGEDIKLTCEGIALVIESIAKNIMGIIKTVAESIITVLQPIMDFIDSIIDKVTDLAKTIAHEIGETIRTVVKTVGDIILGIIRELVNAIPNLLNAILNFCGQIGPAIENSINAIIRAVTALINFIISGIEYMINTLIIGSINKLLSAIPFVGGMIQLNAIEITRFAPKYEQGTNYVPNDGLAYLHQGEAVVPKKYNQPYQQGMSNEERAYMQQMMVTMRSLDGTMKQGLKVNGEFRQRGSDLVAIVNKTKSQNGADLLSNVSYAR